MRDAWPGVGGEGWTLKTLCASREYGGVDAVQVSATARQLESAPAAFGDASNFIRKVDLMPVFFRQRPALWRGCSRRPVGR
jgi:hypothetical protein